MKAGQEVGYIDEDGVRHRATIDEVAGKGPSDYKKLNLTYMVEGEPVVALKVPHENDAEEGAAFWLEKGVARKPVVEPEAVAEAVVETPKKKKSRS